MDSKRLGDDIDDEHDDGWPLKDIVSIVSVCGSTDQHRSHETANLETCSRARLSQVLDSYYWYLVYLTGGLVTSDWSAILATILFFISHLGLEVDCKWLHFSRVVINDMKSLSYLESGHFRRMLNTKFDGCLAIVIEFQRHLQLHFDESHFDSCSNRRPLIQLQFRCFSETGFLIFHFLRLVFPSQYWLLWNRINRSVATLKIDSFRILFDGNGRNAQTLWRIEAH